MASKVIPAFSNILISQRSLGSALLCQRLSSVVRYKSSSPNLQRVVEKTQNDKQTEAHAVRYKKPKGKWLLQGADLSKYTHLPIPYPKTGGRDWNGRVLNKRIGGGAKQMYRMVDFTRNPINKSEPLVERILTVQYDALRSADIALVCNGTHKRWIIAGEKMKKGDLVKSCGDIPVLPVAANDGDAHPLGALAIGTVIHNIEVFEKHGGTIARAAGTCGTIVRKTDDKVIVSMPSGREVSVSKYCMATVGRVSNLEKQPIGSAQRNRWFGVRPKSGLWHKKTGYNGRRIRPPKKLITYETKAKTSVSEMFDS